MYSKTCTTEPSGDVGVGEPYQRTLMHSTDRLAGSNCMLRPPRIAFYSHDAMGMGHVRRNLLIASSLASGPCRAEVLLIAGTREASFFVEQAGLDCITLPALTKDRNGHYKARHFDWTLEKTTRLRSRVIASALVEFQPDVLVIDKLPQGIGNELNRSLRFLRRRGQTQCVLGLRDILDDPLVAAREWRSGRSEETFAEFFDELWIYGDRSVYDCVSEYGFSQAIAQRAYFTGYLDQRMRLTGNPRQVVDQRLPCDAPFALCIVGGGQDGFDLAKAFVQSGVPAGWQGIVITGPFMPAAQRGQLAQMASVTPNMQIVDRLVETDYYLKHARRVVSMGGYNSVTAILSYGKPALIVPRTVPRKEQWVRATRLEQSGWVTTLHPQMLSPESIREWLVSPIVRAPTQGCVDLNGLDRIHSRVVDLFLQARK